MSVREIQGHLLGCMDCKCRPERISTGTGEVLTEAPQWQQRPLRKGLKIPPVTWRQGSISFPLFSRAVHERHRHSVPNRPGHERFPTSPEPPS